MKKLAELEATAPKASKKKMLNEDSTTPPINVSNKPASLKDMFEMLSENVAPGQKPLPVLDPQKKQAGMGFVTSNNPSVQNILKNLDPKDVQIVQAPGQQPMNQQQQTQQQSGQPNQAGATGQPMQQGQLAVKEVDMGQAEKGMRKSTPHTGGYCVVDSSGKVISKHKNQRDAMQAALKNDDYKVKPIKEAQLDELSSETMLKYRKKADDDANAAHVTGDDDRFDKRVKGIMSANRLLRNKKTDEGAKVDRMVKHIAKSERKLGKSKDEAEDIAWATANKRGMLDNKNKKKVKEADIPSTHSQDTMGAGLGAGRSATTLESKSISKAVDKSEKQRQSLIKKAARELNSKTKPTTAEQLVKKYDLFPKDAAAIKKMAKELSKDKVEEGKKPDFLDLDKDGNKKESMKKAAADKKKKKVDESMNHRISAARLEGKSHGLRGHAHSGRRYEDLEELKAYHEGYKEGLDESYGMGMYETAPAATVPGMATQALDELSNATLGSYVGKASASMHDLASDEAYYREPGRFGGDSAVRAADKIRGKAERRHQGINTAVGKLSQPAMEDEMDEGNAFTAALAKTPKGGKFTVGGKTYTDRTNYDTKVDEYAFESLDKQLNALLNESQDLSEGLSVSVSKGQQNSPDSVTITAQDAEAEQLLQLVKHAGLGLFGDDHAEPSSAMSVQPSMGEPDEVGAGGVDVEVIDGNDGIMGLMQKLSGIQTAGGDDYEDEEGGEEQLHGNHSDVGQKDCDCEGDCECDTNEETCNECGGMMEAGHSCGSKMAEDESEDQMEFEVSEDNAPDSDEAETSADEDAEAEEDKALAGADSGEEEEIDESMESLLEKLSNLAETKEKKTFPTSYAKGSEEEKVAHEKDKMVAKALFGKKSKDKEKVDEWANDAGKKGTDASFEQDIDFMTKVIAGGLNKPKSTGQTTVPVITGQEDRMTTPKEKVTESINDWVKLAGIKKS